MNYDYVVVLCDHHGDWHAVTPALRWSDALVAFGAVVHTLTATDYYDDVPPTAAKIVRSHETDYAAAHAVAFSDD